DPHRHLAHGAERAVVHLEVVELEHRRRSRRRRLVLEHLDLLAGIHHTSLRVGLGHRMLLLVDHHRVPRRAKNAATARDSTMSTNAMTIKVSAAPQARSWA